MRQDTAPQLATRLRSYTIRWDTGPRAVYTCQQSQFLADWQHQQVNRTGTSAFPRCAGQQRQRGESGGRGIYAGTGKTEGGGAARPIVQRTVGHFSCGSTDACACMAHTIIACVSAFRRKNGRLYARPHNGGSAGSLQRSGFRENPTNILTFVAR